MHWYVFNVAIAFVRGRGPYYAEEDLLERGCPKLYLIRVESITGYIPVFMLKEVPYIGSARTKR